MDQNGFNSFDDFINFCRNTCNGNSNSSEDCNNCKFGNKTAEASESSRCADSDIPGGFQDINPQLFTIATTILGTLFASNMPFNIQGAVANWLALLGQSISTFNAQQQYFQGGPGRIYDPVYRNAANPFCSTSSDESQRNGSSNENSVNSTAFSAENTTYYNLDDEIKQLKNYINDLSSEVKNLRNQVEELKKDMR